MTEPEQALKVGPAGGDGGPRAGVEFDEGRTAAALELAGAYGRALTLLHPQDLEEQDWYRAQLRDARRLAGLSPLGVCEDEL
jgi:hypothetical protein